MKIYKVPALLIPLLLSFLGFSQTKVGGYLLDHYNEPIAYANIFFPNTTIGTISDENGHFYLESGETHKEVTFSFLGYESQTLSLNKKINMEMKIILKEEASTLNQVYIISGKQSKKEEENPAIGILKKIWAKKRINGLKKFKKYAFNKYEKVEFDLNSIDSALIKSRLFKGMEFVFEKVDTSKITGKSYLPIFINESYKKVWGNNLINKEKEKLIANKNSGFNNNQLIIDFIDDLYSDYNVYDNYLKIFDKNFVSPLSQSGIHSYNYVLTDSAFIDNKWCFNIVYYPRRKSELTFKGDFWVNDSTFAIKEINLEASKSANINWVKEIYIEQEFNVLNDSVFLLKRDYFLSDFSINKKEKSRGVYGKRTTLYNDFDFKQSKPNSFFKDKVFDYNPEAYEKEDVFWETHRMEKLNKDEKGIYQMLDTLKTVKKFKRIYNLASILASGYIEFPSINMDYGPIFSSFGYNEVEGFRLRAGGRTYFSQNDSWRIEGFMAYGFRDDKFKYGISGKWLIDKHKRIIIAGGNRRDIEQIGASLTTSSDVLGRSLASSSIVGTGANNKLTNINLTSLSVEIEPIKNWIFNLSANYRTLESASPTFSLDYLDTNSPTGISSDIKQFETSFSTFIFPGRKMSGYGVERALANEDFPRLFARFSLGSKGIWGSDFNYSKVQVSYLQPWLIGVFGRLYTNLEVGKTFGTVPLALLSVIPGNQTFYSIYNSFSQLDFYEFVTDTYSSLHIEHNFNGRIFSRIPLVRNFNLRAIVGLRGAWGSLNDQNRDLNITGNPYEIPLIAPNNKVYYEYSFGIANIFKVFRIDFNFRGNYLDTPGARNFGITGIFGFHF